MAQRLIPPLAQVLDDEGQPRAGARLFFYLSGTSTKANTYSNAALSAANSNPLTLNEFGQPSVAVFGQNLQYKVVLAGVDELGTDDPPSNVIATYDPVSSSDFASFFKATTGSVNPNGTVAGTAGSAGVLPDTYWDYSAKVLYVCTTTGTTSTAVWTAINASSATPAVPPPQGYLTLTSGTPVITGDVAATSTVYYTPDVGALVPVYNGSSFTPTEFTELTLTLTASHALSTIYDVFIFSNAGVLTLFTGPAWSNSAAGVGARGTGGSTTQLARAHGLYTNAVAITGRNGATTYSVGANLATYLGSIMIDGVAGQISCHRTYGQLRKWGVWNAFNRKPTIMKAGDPTASWSYLTNTLRPANGSANNSLQIFAGLAEEVADLAAAIYVGGSLTNNQTTKGQVGIGYNVTSSAASRVGQTLFTNSSGGNVVFNISIAASAKALPWLGFNTVTLLESGLGADVATWSGTEAFMALTAQYRV